ncbi:MAG: 16S rRNA (cytosine(1402)-N(4))-methyltransferase RsmH [Cytophagales bacterium]|nr:16S rRNA (cytosine(1402)-N(4))-methyltransferase RsmH [Cytophagales bacterium]
MYHLPVLLHESIEALDIQPHGIYADLTYGGGGHSSAIINKLTTGKLFAIDQDADAEANAAKHLSHPNFTFIKSNFDNFSNYLTYYGAHQVDGILADLGVSSHQFDTGSRGFSFRYDGVLDMRMNTHNTLTAKYIVNKYDEQKLTHIFKNYGEIHNSLRLAQEIIRQRVSAEINTTMELRSICENVAPKYQEYKYLAQVFQALRMEVNDELAALKNMLEKCPGILKKNGRLVILSYHSLEDRLVKNFLRSGKFEGEEDKDLFGNSNKPFRPLHGKAVTPTDTELANNPRARSAKMRVGVRI